MVSNRLCRIGVKSHALSVTLMQGESVVASVVHTSASCDEVSYHTHVSQASVAVAVAAEAAVKAREEIVSKKEAAIVAHHVYNVDICCKPSCLLASKMHESGCDCAYTS